MPGDADVLCAGSITVDVIAAVDRLPGEDERTVARHVEIAAGGPAATAAVALARLGFGVAFAGVTGADAAGDAALAGLAAAGVDVSAVVRDPAGRTAASVVLLEEGSTGRRIITSPPRQVPPISRAPRAAWVHVDHVGYPAGARHAREHGLRLSVDAGNPVDDLCLRDVTLYAPTSSALRRRYPDRSLTDAILAAKAEGAAAVVATDGPRGCVVAGDGAPVRVPGFDVPVVSTLGAGDVFHGALLAGLLLGRDLEGAALFANAVAALSCQALDGQSAIPTCAAAMDLLSRAATAEGLGLPAVVHHRIARTTG